MRTEPQRDLVHDLILPALLFAALGGMSWAVRGSAGYGGSAGCIFAGVLWGAAWWFIAREPGFEQTRRYSSAWIVLAVTVGVGFSGARGWMQWPSFFEGKMQTNYAKGEFVPISQVYGFVWLFIAGMPWAGVGACLLAWCGSIRETRAWHWVLRLACGIGGLMLARHLYGTYPQYFLPLYESMQDRYQDLENNPNLRRLINDSGSAIAHLGLYLGLLLYEILRRDGKNVLLILTVGIVNGAGWAMLQNWKWAPGVWENTGFNWWRCWESSGGISIGIAYGLAYYFVNRRMDPQELSRVRARRSIQGPNSEWLAVYLGLIGLASLPMLMEQRDDGTTWRELLVMAIPGVLALFGLAYCVLRRHAYNAQTAPPTEAYGDPNLQRFGLYVGLILGLGFSIRNGLKGFFRVYYDTEAYWAPTLWVIIAPVIISCLVALGIWILARPLSRNFQGNVFPEANALIWLTLIVQNVLAQMITGPLRDWSEFAFNIYYVLLFLITAAIVIHYSVMRRMESAAGGT